MDLIKTMLTLQLAWLRAPACRRKTIPVENYQNIKAILTLKLDYQKFKARMNERLNDDMNGNGLTTFLIASLIYYIGTQIMGQFS